MACAIVYAMNNFIKKTVVWTVLIMPVVALIAPSGMFFPFITGKNFLFRIAVELAFFLYATLAIMDSAYRPKWNALTISFSAFVGIIFVANIFSISPSVSFWSNFERMDGFVTLIHLLAYFFVVSSILKTVKDWEKWIVATASVSVFMTLFCFLQLGGEAVINQGGVRVDGLLGNAAYLGTYLLFHVFFLLYLLVTRGFQLKGIATAVSVGSGAYIVYYLLRLAPGGNFITNLVDHNAATTPGLILLGTAVVLFVVSLSSLIFRKVARFEVSLSAVFFGLVILSQIVVIYLTATRGATLGLIGGLLLAALFIAWKEKENKNLRRGAFGLIGLVAVVVLGFLAVKNTAFVQNDPVLSRFASISVNDNTQARAYVWPMAIKGFTENPVLGWGQESFIYVFQKYYVPEMFNQEPWFDRAHNVFLDWLVAGGILGFLAYLSLFVSAVYLLWKSEAFSVRGKAVLLGLLAAYAFQNLFIFDNIVSYLLFASLLALIASGYNTKSLDSRSDAEEVGPPLVVSAIVVFAIVAFLVNWNGYKQNVTLIKALTSGGQGAQVVLSEFNNALAYDSFGTFEGRTQLSVATMQVLAAPQVNDANKLAFATTTIVQLQTQIEKTPQDARPYILLGDFLSTLGDHDNAITILEKARTISPKKQPILISLSQAYLRKAESMNNDAESIEKGLAVAKEAYESAPQFDNLAFIYAQLLIVGEKADEAIVIANTIENTSIFVDQDFIKSLIEKNHTKDAIALLRKEIARDPRHTDAYVMLANVYLYLKDKPSAIKAFKDLELVRPELKEAISADLKQIETL
jgi:O-antigen ligase/Flp pilus assembly protein TadD